MPADFPASFIGRDDGAPPDLGTQRLVGRLRLPRGAMDRMDQSAPGHGEAEAIAQQVPDPAEGESTLFIENHGERDRLRPELHGRGAERVGGLQWVSALHAAVTLPALAHRDTKLMDDGALDGQVFLVLRDDAAAPHRSAAVRTLRGQRRVVGHVDARRRAPMGRAAVHGARLAPRALGMLLRQAAGKRRRLAVGTAACHLEFLFQPFVLTAQPVAFDLRAFQIFTEPLDLSRLVINDLVLIFGRRIRRASRHATVMPDSRAQYKRECGPAGC